MDIIPWIVVGLIAGSLASYITRDSGFSVPGNILLGMAGAVVGGWAFQEFGLQSPIGGIAGTILVASVGAIIVLLAIHVIWRNRRGAASSRGK